MSLRPPSNTEHGHCLVERTENIIRISVAEGINQELVKRYQQEMARELAVLNGSLWGVHLVINGDVLMTPEATERLIQETSRHLALGRCGTAIELVNSQAISILRSFWSRIYQEADVPYCFVNNRQEAVDWLQQQIAAAQSRRAGGAPE